MIQFNGDNLNVPGTLTVGGNILPAKNRTSLLQEDNAVYSQRLEAAVVDATGQPLPTAGSGSILGLYLSAIGTGNLYWSSGDVKNATTSRQCRISVDIPVEYVGGQTVALRFAAGMLTTAASGSCTLDIEVWKVGRNTLVTGSDLYSGAAVSINSTTFADKTLQLDSSGILPGDRLDIRVTLACVDVATGTVVKPSVAAFDVLCDIQG